MQRKAHGVRWHEAPPSQDDWALAAAHEAAEIVYSAGGRGCRGSRVGAMPRGREVARPRERRKGAGAATDRRLVRGRPAAPNAAAEANAAASSSSSAAAATADPSVGLPRRDSAGEEVSEAGDRDALRQSA